MMDFIWQSVAGLLSGGIGALGLGGGAVLLLYLTAIAGENQLKSQGINLLFFLPIAALSLVVHTKNGLVRWKFAILCAICGLIGVWAGSWVAGLIGESMLRKVFAIGLVLLGVYEFFHKEEKKADSPNDKGHRAKIE
jgi:uncharacterized membrane protein YfcA